MSYQKHSAWCYIPHEICYKGRFVVPYICITLAWRRFGMVVEMSLAPQRDWIIA